jgi:hypothetical protein
LSVSNAGQPLLAQRGVEDDRIARLWITSFDRYPRHHHHGVAALLERTNQRCDVLRVDQRLVGQRDDHCIEPGRQGLQPRSHRRRLAIGRRWIAHERDRKLPDGCFDRIGVMAQHDGDLVDTRARQGDQLTHDQRHAAQLEQRLRPPAQALAGTRGQQHGAHRHPAVEPVGLIYAAHANLLLISALR